MGKGKARVILCHTPRELDDIIITMQCVEKRNLLLRLSVSLRTILLIELKSAQKNLDVSDIGDSKTDF